MVCGTASDVGKTYIVAGLCRFFSRQGYKVAPFKAQNMALNSFVTLEGHEISRAQAIQAMAGGVEPQVSMNPVLLKPNNDRTSQVIVMGKSVGTMDFIDYLQYKKELFPTVLSALDQLQNSYDIVICEGAGGAAEINLLQDDIVNLNLAYTAGIPAIVVGDIERGGVFASLYGTVEILPSHLKSVIKALVVNKFRGEKSLLKTGIDFLEDKLQIPMLGIIPYLSELAELDAEDSLAIPKYGFKSPTVLEAKKLNLAIIALPHISNFTDFDPLFLEQDLNISFIQDATALYNFDLIFLPGTKQSVEDLLWMEEKGFVSVIQKMAISKDPPFIMGICGGYQILGKKIYDGIESSVDSICGIGLLSIETVMKQEKILSRRQGSALGHLVNGYEIHHGRVEVLGDLPFVSISDSKEQNIYEGTMSKNQKIFGTSMHGLFENDSFRRFFLEKVAKARAKPFKYSSFCYKEKRASQTDVLANALADSLDMESLVKLMENALGVNPILAKEKT